MIYQPTIGIITNIGVHHLDGCLNLEGYIKAKEEIIGGIKKGATLILNADDQNNKKLKTNTFKGKNHSVLEWMTNRNSGLPKISNGR